ncbi:hypothetical protein [Pengzhenrongella phosphoraccumulans]|uniref:hypothetical protein n=1 Tax=Pengzhenrongella phosphoraccumulans TaxID=3114394 RepID=UPI00388D6341
MPDATGRQPHLQATTVARRLGRVLRFGAPSGWYGTPAVWDGWWPPPSVTATVAARLDTLLPEQRSRYDQLLTMGSDAGVPMAVLERAFAAGARLDALAFLAAAWPELTDRDRAQVATPLVPVGRAREVNLGDERARQTDATTCGSAVLTMLAAAGDPLLALWLVTGRAAVGGVPREVRALSDADRAAPDVAGRFGAVQRAVKILSNRSAVGPFPWPAGLGTPPRGAARAARFPGAAFRSVLIDDTQTTTLRALLSRAERSLAAGVGVPLFTGGDLGGGLAAAFPRHVVLLTPGPDQASLDAGRYTVYEPSSGSVHEISRAELLAPDGPAPPSVAGRTPAGPCCPGPEGRAGT